PPARSDFLSGPAADRGGGACRLEVLSCRPRPGVGGSSLPGPGACPAAEPRASPTNGRVPPQPPADDTSQPTDHCAPPLRMPVPDRATGPPDSAGQQHPLSLRVGLRGEVGIRPLAADSTLRPTVRLGPLTSPASGLDGWRSEGNSRSLAETPH